MFRSGALRLFATAIISAFASSAFAGPVYLYDIDNPNGSAAAGDILNITTQYDAGSETLSWQYTIDSLANDSFWLVLSGGDNPKGDNGQFGIFYGDLVSGDLTVYEYNGQNASNSYKYESLIATYTDALTVVTDGSEQTVSFEVDVSVVNSYKDTSDWEGAQFADKIGIWFHPAANTNVAGSSFTYDNDGNIVSYKQGSVGWHDGSNADTVQVPEPGTLALMALGLMSLVFVGRGRKINA